MSTYTFDLISQVGLIDSQVVDTRIKYNTHLNHDNESFHDATLYKWLGGGLIHITITKPNISYVVHIVIQFVAAPRSLNILLSFEFFDSWRAPFSMELIYFTFQSPFTLHAYTNAIWKGDPTNSCSITVLTFYLLTLFYLGST